MSDETRPDAGQRLDGRVAVLSGAARGIGRATAELLGLRGAHVVLLDRDEIALVEASSTLRASGITHEYAVLDVRDLQDCATILDDVALRHGRLDILVNSAGVLGPFRVLWEISAGEWEDVMATNLTGTFNMCRAAIPHMLNRWGRIVNIASIAGKDGAPAASAYSASKAAVIGLTKSLGKELAQHGVLVNAIAPALIGTDMVAGIAGEHHASIVARIPMGRVGSGDEVARLIGFLCSPELSFSTGAVYDISGGRATY